MMKVTRWILTMSLSVVALLPGPAEALQSGDPPASAPDNQVGCEGRGEYEAMSFWVGTWRVSAVGIEQGTNRIERVLGGCAILEHWTDVLGGEGKSLFYIDPVRGTWKQVWVTDHAYDPAGGVLEKQQVGQVGAALVFEGQVGSNPAARSRTTLTPEPDGTVLQLIERSDDGGATWWTTFDAIYEPIDDPTPQTRD